MKIYTVPTALSGLIIPQELPKGAKPLQSATIAKTVSGIPKVLTEMPDIVRKALTEIGLNPRSNFEVHEFEVFA